MSRAAPAKTRGADKTEPPASQTPVIAHEIVPGKFNDNDWNVMVDRDGADEFVQDIVDELMETTMSAIYDKYIQSQLLPFTITQARDAITEIIEWQFLARDEGELHIETDLGWSQDEEPEPAVTDCWAQGSVPRNIVVAPEVPLEEIPEETAEQEEAEAEEDQPKHEEQAEPPELADVVSESEYPTKSEAVPKSPKHTEMEGPDKEPAPPSDQKEKPRKKFRPYKGKLKSAGVRHMTESLEETEMKMMYEEISGSRPLCDEMPSTILNMPASCTSILKVQTGRPPGNKDVVYDDFGNVVAVMKLDPEKMPTHKINVKYHVVDPAVEAAQARLDAMRKGKSTGSKVKKVRSTNRSLNTESMTTIKRESPRKKTKMKESPKKRKVVGTKMKVSAPSSTMAPLPPPLPKVSKSVVNDSNTNVVEEVVESKVSKPKDSKSVVNDSNTSVVEQVVESKVSKIEEMEVSHGVIIREGGRVKKGPGRYYGKLDVLEESQKGMNPVALRITNPGITVADLLDRHTPILRPLSDSSPLPPIVPQPQHQAQQAT